MASRKFEESWKNAFEGAEAVPPDSVWFGVESGLIDAENKRMKQNVAVYQRLAAAAAIFALMLGALAFYYWLGSGANIKAVHNSLENKGRGLTKKADGTGNELKSSIQIPASGNNQKPSQLPSSEMKERNAGIAWTTQSTVIGMADSKDRIQADARKTTPDSAGILKAVGATVNKESATENSTMAVENSSSPADSTVKNQKSPEDKIQVLDSAKSQDDEKIIERRSYKSETLWVAIGASTGNYNPGSESGSSAGGNYSGVRHALGTSNSIGFTIAHRFAKRWVIQSGITYLNQSQGYTSNLVAAGSYVLPSPYLGYYPTTPGISTTGPYQINSVLEYISVPVQAGYLIAGRRIGFQLNAGVAADFFIRNSLRDQAGQLGSFSKGAGSDSPYRSVNWAGLVSAELSYKVGARYRLSIVPGMLYSLKPVLKSGTDHPHVTDIGFRFRYILK